MKMRSLELAILGSLVSVVQSQGASSSARSTVVVIVTATSGIFTSVTTVTELSLNSVATTPTGSSTSAPPSTTSAPPFTASSSSSPTPTVETTSNEGLTSGAKAGIGIGIALVAIFALLLASFCFWRRKKQATQRDKQDLETADDLTAERGNEMITSANTHEMDAKRPSELQVVDANPDKLERFQELETLSIPVVDSTSRPEVPAEMDVPYNTQSTNVGSDWEHLQPSELDGNTSAQPRAELSSSLPTELGPTSAHPLIAPLPILNTPQSEGPRSLDPGSTPAPMISPPNSPGEPEDKLEALRKRMESVREDKERLEKIQALKDLEAELQAEILAEQKKATGS